MQGGVLPWTPSSYCTALHLLPLPGNSNELGKKLCYAEKRASVGRLVQTSESLFLRNIASEGKIAI